jgi:translocator protein
MTGGWRWPLANLVALAGTVVVNGLANALPLNGQTTGDVINRDPVLFLPANWVFSIWGLIYLSLAVFVVYGLLPAGRRNPRLARISPLFVLSCLANGVWLFLWHWERLPLSMVAMLVLLGSLIGIYGRLRAGGSTPSRGERLALWWPFSLYLGWVSVATIANATVTLDRAGWDGWGIAPAVWAAIMIVVGGALAVALGLGLADPVYAAVFVWAFVGLAVRQQDTALVAGTAAIVAVAAAVVALIAALRRLRGGPALPAGAGA